MNEREKRLAAAVGGLLVLVVGFFGLTTASEMLDQRQKRVQSLEKTLREKQRDVTLGKHAAAKMNRFAEHSLPSDSEKARSLYQAWLLELVNRAGLQKSTVKAEPARPRGDVYMQHAFGITGRADLRQLTDMLHEFYSMDLLHRIKSLSVTPVPESNLLDLTLKVEALSLTDAAADAQLPSNKSIRLAFSRDEYRDAILNRNLFGPPNNAPKLASVSKREVRRGERLSLDVTARDPDERQTLQYALVGRPPDGMRIDSRTGRLEWSPRQTGEYQVTVQVRDDGLPAKRDEATITIAVVDPPPPAPTPVRTAPPTFNIAQFSVLTAITEKAGRKQVWIHVRPEGRMLKLYEGDEITVGEFTGIVREILRQQVVIEAGDDLLVVAQGKALTDAQHLP